VGEKGKEVDPDDYGRVKVQFHWDRYGKMDENSSCWVRVSQPWAGKGYGCMNIPRIGQEVVVEFIEGDPDRPLINGRLYHAENMPHASNAGRDGKKGNQKPKGLSGAGQMTSFKSNSLGGSGGHNEITMNDEGGKEGLFFKAQKDEIHNVGNDREDTVGNNETRKVKVDQSLEVGNNQTEKIGVNANETVGVAKVIEVGTTFMLKAGTSITLQCGASTIHMNQAGVITISGMMISIAGAINCNMAAPITNIVGACLLTNSGLINASTGLVSHFGGGTYTHISGSTVENLASGDNIVKGATVKVN
jgi:type VI secretion system secreted protein VgrG